MYQQYSSSSTILDTDTVFFLFYLGDLGKKELVFFLNNNISSKNFIKKTFLYQSELKGKNLTPNEVKREVQVQVQVLDCTVL